MHATGWLFAPGPALFLGEHGRTCFMVLACRFAARVPALAWCCGTGVVKRQSHRFEFIVFPMSCHRNAGPKLPFIAHGERELLGQGYPASLQDCICTYEGPLAKRI